MIFTDALKALIESTFDQAAHAAESHSLLDRSAERAQAQLSEGVLGDAGYRQAVDAIRENREQVRQRLEASIAQERERFDAATAVLTFDPSSLSPQVVGFVGSVPLADEEARQMLAEAAMRGDLATWRLVEANLSRQGKHLGFGLTKYVEGVSGIADETMEYARSIGSEDSAAYLENSSAIASKLAGKALASEAAFMSFPIIEGENAE